MDLSMKTNQGVQSEELVEEKRPFIHQSIKSRVVMMNLVCRFFDRCHGSTEHCVECQSRMKSLPVYSLRGPQIVINYHLNVLLHYE